MKCLYIKQFQRTQNYKNLYEFLSFFTLDEISLICKIRWHIRKIMKNINLYQREKIVYNKPVSRYGNTYPDKQ